MYLKSQAHFSVLKEPKRLIQMVALMLALPTEERANTCLDQHHPKTSTNSRKLGLTH